MDTRRLPRRLPVAVAVVLAAVPVLSMLFHVLGASRMQWNDYWDILPRVTNPDGSFSPRGALEFQNEHPVAIPGAIYWTNAKLTGGSNNALGLYVVSVALATAGILLWAVQRAMRSDRAQRLAFGVALVTLVFATRGVHNFVFSMSGTAWLTANLFACAALFVAWRWSPYAALPFAALAGLSYGTGLATFPVLVAIAVLEGRPRRVVVSMVVATIVAVALYLSQYEAPRWAPGTAKTAADVTRRWLQVLGAPFAHDLEVATLVGAVLPCVVGVVLAAAHRQGRLAELASWIGLLAYASAGALAIAWSRGGLPDEAGVSSRYVSLGALAWIATFVLLAVTFRRPTVTVPVVALAALIAFVSGQKTVSSIVETRYYSDELAIALRLGAEPSASDRRFSTAAIPTLRLLDHYPFNDDFDLDCGLLGDRIDVDALPHVVPFDEEGVHGALTSFGTRSFSTATELTGWVSSDGRGTSCIVFVDDGGTVVGAAAHGDPDGARIAAGDPYAELFSGAATTLPDGATYRAVAIIDDEQVLLSGELTVAG